MMSLNCKIQILRLARYNTPFCGKLFRFFMISSKHLLNRKQTEQKEITESRLKLENMFNSLSLKSGTQNPIRYIEINDLLVFFYSYNGKKTFSNLICFTDVWANTCLTANSVTPFIALMILNACTHYDFKLPHTIVL